MEDQYEQFLVFDFVHDAVIAGANSPLTGATDELGRGRWSRIGTAQFDIGLSISSGYG